MKFLDWYLKIGVVSALVGASMELFMIKTGFLGEGSRRDKRLLVAPRTAWTWVELRGKNWNNDKVTVLESEKRAWENSPEAQAVRDALNPWRHVEAERTKSI
ncbi:uncharacterized protein LOC107625215 isoform X1 [Arachis ipaensis]|uniref:uncharacterized protein LOC107625215 isoform X1 n=1 Tax=Arachis ipaensis TaxID=130454 RepID=UPI000A2B9491|nr:uncharacterized protein LOC107625215 isoform X1 [Arachis ipaensis]XP_025632754.1 uncharacterized protein LOC112727289 isoform X1 [Arachis hypogaea]